MACALQAVVAAANTCTFPTQRFFNTKYHSVSKRSSSLSFTVRASTEDPDCNDEECAPDKEVGLLFLLGLSFTSISFYFFLSLITGTNCNYTMFNYDFFHILKLLRNCEFNHITIILTVSPLVYALSGVENIDYRKNIRIQELCFVKQLSERSLYFFGKENLEEEWICCIKNY